MSNISCATREPIGDKEEQHLGYVQKWANHGEKRIYVSVLLTFHRRVTQIYHTWVTTKFVSFETG
jgi:hypothetical protein